MDEVDLAVAAVDVRMAPELVARLPDCLQQRGVGIHCLAQQRRWQWFEGLFEYGDLLDIEGEHGADDGAAHEGEEDVGGGGRAADEAVDGAHD